MPASLHRELSDAAAGERVSMNQFVAAVLARAVGWRAGFYADTHDPAKDQLSARDWYEEFLRGLSKEG